MAIMINRPTTEMTRRRERLGSGIRQDEYTKTMNIPVDIFLSLIPQHYYKYNFLST